MLIFVFISTFNVKPKPQNSAKYKYNAHKATNKGILFYILIRGALNVNQHFPPTTTSTSMRQRELRLPAPPLPHSHLKYHKYSNITAKYAGLARKCSKVYTVPFGY